MVFKFLESLTGVRFVREVGALQLGKAASLLAGFGASVVYARVLGPSQYGIYAIVTSLAGMISAFINLGIWPTCLTLLSEAVGRQNREEVRNLVIYFVKVTLFITNGFWLLVLIFAQRLVTLVYNDPSLALYLRLTVLINAAAVLFLLLTLCYQVLRRINQVTLLETGKKFLSVGLAVGLVLAGLGVVGIFYGLLFAELFFLVFSLVFLLRLPKVAPLFPTIRELSSSFWRVKAGRYLKFGLQIAADKNLNNFVETLPGFLVGVLSTPEQAGLFRVASQVGDLPKIFSANISRMLATIFPMKVAQAPATLKEDYHKVAKLGTILTLGMIAAVFVGTRLLFRLFYGEQFLLALPALYVVLLTNMLLGFAVSFGPLVRTLKKMGASIKLNILALALAAGIGYLAIPHLGALGGALSMLGWFVVSIILIFKIEAWLKEPLK